uniref:Uncharacterized protein n=1 Tax=Anopheles coluzzii TaxID=1518534 RepID=A0A8W7P2D1_ANOCL
MVQLPVARDFRRDRANFPRVHPQRPGHLVLDLDREQLLDDVLGDVGLFRAEPVQPFGEVLGAEIDQFLDLLEERLVQQLLVGAVVLRLPLDPLVARLAQLLCVSVGMMRDRAADRSSTTSSNGGAEDARSGSSENNATFRMERGVGDEREQV